MEDKIPNASTNTRMDVPFTQTDATFINYCINSITEDGLLPFSLPVKAFPRIIRDSASWFYRECSDATIEKWYGIKRHDLEEDLSKNKTIRLPDDIESVMEIKQVNATHSFATLARFMREPIMFASTMNMLGSGGSAMQGLGNPYRMTDRDIAFEECFTRMYEYSLLKTLLLKGVRFDFNPFSKELNLLGRVDTDIVLSTLTRIPLCKLYNDVRFRQYVCANAIKRIKKIVGMFDFQYPGDVKINFDELESEGKERVKEIEEEIKSESDASDIFLMK